MTVRPCLGCGQLTDDSRCARCAPPRRPHGRADQHRRQLALTRDQHRCRRCGATGVAFEVDHVRPLAHGGRDTLANTWTLCVPCHRRKSAAETRARSAERHARAVL